MPGERIWSYGGNGSINIPVPRPSGLSNSLLGGNILTGFLSSITTFWKIENVTWLLNILLLIVIIGIILWVVFRKKSESFENSSEISNQNGKAMVLFYTDWCSACQSFKNTWKELVEKHRSSDLVAFKKVNCEKNPDAVKKYKLEGYPTIILFKNGQPASIFEGERTVQNLEKFMNA